MINYLTCAILAVMLLGSVRSLAADPILINYYRFDEQHTKSTLWTWDGTDTNEDEIPEVEIARQTDFGVQFELDPSVYGAGDSVGQRIGFLPRLNRSWDQKDGSDRYWVPSMGNEIWLIGNDPKIYTEAPDVSPIVLAAYQDTMRDLNLKLSAPWTDELIRASQVELKDAEGNSVEVANARVLEEGTVRVMTAVDLPVGGKLFLSIEGYRPGPVVPRRVLDDKSQFHTTETLGAIYSKDETIFRLFSPFAYKAAVILYDNTIGPEGRNEVAMASKGKGVWEATVSGDLEGKFYMFRTTTPARGEGPETIDPYATNTTGNDGRGRITDLRKTDPEGFRPVNRPEFSGHLEDAIIYEIHVRDFTVDESSGVEAAGKYLGFIERGRTHPDDPSIATGFDHLVEMGVTHVQLLPPHDAHNDESKFDYNWGYMTSHFNSLEGIYSSNYRDDSRIREFKQLVKALHDVGIGVIVDVVYNHTAPDQPFERIAPGYYHRMRPDGSFWNGSGTGNETRSEAPMMRQYMLDSLRYWMEEYGVDGYRFDLMGLHDLETMKQVRDMMKEIHPGSTIHGEPWTGGASGLDIVTDKNRVSGSHIGAFNDHFRNSIKGSSRGPQQGYIQAGYNRDGIKLGIAGSIDDWATNPSEPLNYASAHDDNTLWDKILISSPGATEQERTDMLNLAFGILAVSQGGLFMHAGVEMHRTKDGVENSYNYPDEINSIDWDWKKKYAASVEWHKDMIAFRKAHSIFRLKSADEIRERLRFLEDNLPEPSTIAFHLDARGVEGEQFEDVVVFVNPTGEPKTFENPLEDAEVFVRYMEASTARGLAEAEKSVVVAPRSITVVATQQ